MALSPEQVETQEFKAAFRGADRNEVSRFLENIAEEMRDLHGRLDAAQAETAEARRSKEAAIAAAAQLPVPPALTNSKKDQEDADKFNDLGDKISSLLRTAEESAEKITTEASDDAADVLQRASDESAEIKAEAEKLLTEAKEDAERIRAEAEAEVASMKTELTDARTNLDAELAETRAAAEADREQAAAELAEAQKEVTELLAEARSQSEFIRQEADEIVRVKVRTDMETAERRMRILQLTEQSSRERLVAAQAELNTALEKLDAEPSPELSALEADAVLEEARDRASNELPSGTGAGESSESFGGNSLDEVFEPTFYENSDADDSSTPADADEEVLETIEVEAEEVSDDAADDEVEDVSSSAEPDEKNFVGGILDDQETGSKYDEAYGFGADDADDDLEFEEVAVSANGSDAPVHDDVVDAEDVAEADVVAEDDDGWPIVENETEDDDTVDDEAVEVEAVGFDAQDVMDETPGVVIEDSISELPTDSQSPLGSVAVPDDSGDLLEDSMAPAAPAPPSDTAEAAIPAALAGTPPPPPGTEAAGDVKVLADEDPLAKLVREAMQRAVDSARGDD